MRAPSEQSAPAAEVTFKAVAVIGFKNGQASAEELTLWYDDNVVADGNLITTKNFSNQSLSSIPVDGPSQFASGRDSQASNSKPVRKDKKRRVTPADPSALFVHLPKVYAAANPLVTAESRHVTFSSRPAALERPLAA